MSPEEVLEEFEQFRKQRWDVGAEQYGEFEFLNKSLDELFIMMYEELADQANYAAFLYVRLRMLEGELASRTNSAIQFARENTEHFVPPHSRSFIGSARIPKVLPER
jgi:hypothetical protein